MSDATPEPHEVYLPPGGFHFGDEDTRIRTLLGSCVAMITLWHPRFRASAACAICCPMAATATAIHWTAAMPVAPSGCSCTNWREAAPARPITW